MKKYIVLIIAVLGLLIIPNVSAAKRELPEITDHEKVKVYLFRGEGCPHCQDFITYFIDVFKDYEDYFEIVSYEAWKDTNNQKLMYAVKKIVGEEENVAVPFIVVGNDYHLLGFGSDSGEKIIDEALKAYQDKKYTDIVAKAMSDEKLSGKSETIVKAAYNEGIKVKKEYLEEEGLVEAKKGLSDGVIVGIVFAVILLGFGGLVLISRK